MNVLEDLVTQETKLIERLGYKNSDFDVSYPPLVKVS